LEKSEARRLLKLIPLKCPWVYSISNTKKTRFYYFSPALKEGQISGLANALWILIDGTKSCAEIINQIIKLKKLRPREAEKFQEEALQFFRDTESRDLVKLLRKSEISARILGPEAPVLQVRGEHLFTLNRGLSEFKAAWNPDFEKALKKGSLEGISWLDAGAGLALPQREYFEELTKGGKSPPWLNLVAIGLKAPEIQIGQKHATEIRFLSGQLFEDLEFERREKFDLITDYTGVLNYTVEPSKVISKYFRLLNDRGQCFVHLPDELTFVLSANGQFLNLKEWLLAQKNLGFQVSAKRSGFILQRASQKLNLPVLELKASRFERVVFRLFVEKKAKKK
jgi:SAM-dependent methyltransferase